MKIQATLKFTYEVTPEQLRKNYETEDPDEVCAIDKEAFENDPGTLLMWGEESEIIVEVVDE